MVHQFFDCGSIIWIFLKTAVQKITYLCTYNQIRWHFDLIFNYFDQLLLSRYFERIFTYHHLIHHNTYRPNIDLLVILLSFEDLGTDIEWSATEGSSEFVILVHRPPEIAKLDDILNRAKDTSWRTMFSGLISLWMIFNEWITLTASHTCFIMKAILG